MGAVIIAARYVPRPPDDIIWSFWTPPRSRETVLDLVGGNFPNKPNWQRHQAFYNDQGNSWNWWVPPRQRESVVDLVGGNFPNKPSWQRHQAFYNDQGNLWYAAPRAVNPVSWLLNGNFPLVPNYQRQQLYYNDAGTEWRAAPQEMPPIFRVAVAAPFAPQWQRQQFTYADAGSEWQPWYPNRAREQVLDLVGGNFPLKPAWQRQQAFYNDAGNEWQPWYPNRARESVLDLVGGNFPFVARWRRMEQYDDPPPWRFQPQAIPAAFALAVVVPLTPNWQRVQQYYADAGSEWQPWYPNRARESVLDLVGGNFPFTARWRRMEQYDDPPPWRFQPQPVPATFQLVIAAPFAPQWRSQQFRYNDAGNEWYWFFPERERAVVLDLVGGNFPFKTSYARHQAFYNDQGNVWNAKPRAVNTAIQIVPAPLPFRPNYAITVRGYDERSLWTYRAKATSLQLILPNVVVVDVSGYLLVTEPPDTARFVVAGPAAGPDNLQYGWPNVIVRRRL